MNPGPGDEVDQNVTLQCSAASRLDSEPVMFAYAASINRTHSICNVLLFPRRHGQGTVSLTLQDDGGKLYGGSNESIANVSVVVSPSNSPPRFSFRSIFPCSLGNVTVNMTTAPVSVTLQQFILPNYITAGSRMESSEQDVTWSVAATSGLRLLQNQRSPTISKSPCFR